MTQTQLEQELALQTGESRRTIRQRGFGLVERSTRLPQFVDWDQREAERLALFPDRQARLA